MLKKLLVLAASLTASVAFANVDINKADQAGLESVKGVGSALSTRILEERKKGPFKDWNDVVGRVQGIGEGNAGRFSSAGLTVNGTAYTSTAVAQRAKDKPAATPVAKKDDKKDEKK
jgi:competence protein ComEA